MKESYKTNEIILGIRKQYLELRKELLKLKELTSSLNNEEVSYEIRQNGSTKENELYVSSRKNHNIFNKLFDHLREIGVTPYHYDYSKLIKDNSGAYSFEDEKFSRLFSITNQEEFIKEIEKIQEMEFCKRLGFKRIYINYVNKDWWNALTIGKNGISISHEIDLNEKRKVGYLAYDPFTDSIEAHGYGSNLFRINNDVVRQLLYVGVPAEKLSDYEKSLIDNSSSANKRIVIDDASGKILNYNIEEYNDYIHLIRKK